MTILNSMAGTYGWLTAWFGCCLLLGIACWGRLGASEPARTPAWPNPELAIFLCVCTGLAVHVLVLIGLAVMVMLLLHATGIVIGQSPWWYVLAITWLLTTVGYMFFTFLRSIYRSN